MEVGNITKAVTFKSFHHLSYENIQFLCDCTFYYFHEKSINRGFFFGGGGIHENMNCAFPLKAHSQFLLTESALKNKKCVLRYLKSSFRSQDI